MGKPKSANDAQTSSNTPTAFDSPGNGCDAACPREIGGPDPALAETVIGNNPDPHLATGIGNRDLTSATTAIGDGAANKDLNGIGSPALGLDAPARVSPRRWESANLDFLRSTAVLLVYVHHLLKSLGLPSWAQMGKFGVLIFFVHTSLVLMLSLERIELRGESIFKSFYIRRLFRIYPLSIFWVSVIVVFHLPRAPWWPWSNPPISAIISNLLLCMNLFHIAPVTSVLWSLPYEVEMYLLFPLLYLFGKARGLRGLWLLWVAAVGVALVQPHVAWHVAWRLDIAQYGPCFGAGVISYFLLLKRRIPRLPFLLWPVTIAVSAGVFKGLGHFLGDELYKPAWPACLLLGLAVPYFRELQWKPLRVIAAQIAKYSYGIYLTHLTAMWIAFVVFQNKPLFIKWIVLAALSISIPVALYHLIEAPLIKSGANLASRRQKPSVVRNLGAVRRFRSSPSQQRRSTRAS